MQPSRVSTCKLLCIVGAASGAGAGVVIGLLFIIIILWITCRSVQLNIACNQLDTCVCFFTFRKRCEHGYESIGMHN